VLFHIILLILSVSFFHPIGELFKDKEVRAVFLVEDKNLVFSEREFLEQEPVQKTENLESPKNSANEETAPVSQDRSTASREVIEQYLTSLYSKSDESEMLADPEILNSFTLDQLDKEQFSLVYDPKSATQILMPDGVQSSYGISSNRGKSGGSGSLNPEWISPQPQGQTPGSIRTRDLTPWANQVLEKIERNWVIDPSRSQEKKGTVGISVTVSKSGEIISVEVILSSGDQTLDSSAKSAVEMSVPLPSLPLMYPSKSIVFTIEFEY
ncbi:energy transducer TonB, partial [Acidobacteriota bacterium]